MIKDTEIREWEWLELLAENKQLVRQGFPRLRELRKLMSTMTIPQAFKHLLDKWTDQDQEFKNKYRSYRSKYLKKIKDPKAEGIGYWKKVEMLEAAGYVEIKVKAPK